MSSAASYDGTRRVRISPDPVSMRAVLTATVKYVVCNSPRHHFAPLYTYLTGLGTFIVVSAFLQYLITEWLSGDS